MGYCFHCGRKMKKVKIYGICSKCEKGLEDLWDYALSLYALSVVDSEDPEGTIQYSVGNGRLPLVQETPDKTVL